MVDEIRHNKSTAIFNEDYGEEEEEELYEEEEFRVTNALSQYNLDIIQENPDDENTYSQSITKSNFTKSMSKS